MVGKSRQLELKAADFIVKERGGEKRGKRWEEGEGEGKKREERVLFWKSSMHKVLSPLSSMVEGHLKHLFFLLSSFYFFSPPPPFFPSLSSVGWGTAHMRR